MSNNYSSNLQIINVSSSLEYLKKISSKDNNASTPIENNRKDSNQSTSFVYHNNKASNRSNSQSKSSISDSISTEESGSHQGEGSRKGIFSNDNSDNSSSDLCKMQVKSMVDIINCSPEILQKIKECNKLKDEINYFEKTIKDLNNKKFNKQSKIDDLRYFINRIAKEDSFTYFVRESKKPARENGNSNIQRTLVSSSSNQNQELESTSCNEDPQGDGVPAKRDNYHLTMCSYYWQDVLPSHNNILSLCNNA